MRHYTERYDIYTMAGNLKSWQLKEFLSFLEKEFGDDYRPASLLHTVYLQSIRNIDPKSADVFRVEISVFDGRDWNYDIIRYRYPEFKRKETRRK